MFTALECVDGDLLRAAIAVEEMRGIGHQSSQSLQGRTGTDDRLHLDPVTEQHDVDQSYEFPEEIITGKPDDRRHAVNVSRGDGDTDQRHHTGIAGADFLPQPVEKRPAAVEIDDT